MGAVTTEHTAVSGCRVQSLGVMRYLPVAAPEFVQDHLGDGFSCGCALIGLESRRRVTGPC